VFHARNRLAGILTFVLLSLTLSSRAQPVLGHPLAGLEKLKDFQTRRASSSNPDWRNGNGDARPIEPGGTLTLAELEGPGVVTHIWFTIAHSAPFYSRLLTLRMYWDGEEHPSVECPVGDFFGIGHGVDKPFMSLPIRVTSDGRARNCYWPMPFRKSARITVTNESKDRCRSFYYYVDWQKHAALPDDTAYFHAMYRQEHPCVMGRNYLLADIEGRGHYVGTVQSVYHTSAGWYGEGDDFFFSFFSGVSGTFFGVSNHFLPSPCTHTIGHGRGSLASRPFSPARAPAFCSCLWAMVGT
jgi:hypothetical protein